RWAGGGNRHPAATHAVALGNVYLAANFDPCAVEPLESRGAFASAGYLCVPSDDKRASLVHRHRGRDLRKRGRNIHQSLGANPVPLRIKELFENASRVARSI